MEQLEGTKVLCVLYSLIQDGSKVASNYLWRRKQSSLADNRALEVKMICFSAVPSLFLKGIKT